MDVTHIVPLHCVSTTRNTVEGPPPRIVDNNAFAGYFRKKEKSKNVSGDNDDTSIDITCTKQ